MISFKISPSVKKFITSQTQGKGNGIKRKDTKSRKRGFKKLPWKAEHDAWRGQEPRGHIQVFTAALNSFLFFSPPCQYSIFRRSPHPYALWQAQPASVTSPSADRHWTENSTALLVFLVRGGYVIRTIRNRNWSGRGHRRSALRDGRRGLLASSPPLRFFVVGEWRETTTETLPARRKTREVLRLLDLRLCHCV